MKLALCAALTVATPPALAQLDPPAIIDSGSTGVPALVATDVDGDGDDDLVAWDFDGVIRWRESRDDDRVPLSRPIGPAFTNIQGPLRVIAFDADGDGREDLLASSPSHGVMVGRNEGGVYGTFSTIAPPGPDQNVVGPLDMDGDGRLDLVTWTDAQVGLMWARNLGGGAFDPPTPVWNAAADVVDATITDLDGDGDEDIVVITDDWPVRVVAAVNIGVPGGMRELVITDTLDTGGEGRFVRAADLTGDGLPEIFALLSWRAYRIDGASGVTFGAPVSSTAPVNYNGSRGMLFSDVDGDGDQDMFEYNAPRWWINDGAGGLVPEPELALTDAIWIADKGDMDGDGLEDIVFNHSNFRQGGWFRNDGTGQTPYTSVATLFMRRQVVWDVEPLDEDGDGDSEIVVLASGSSQLQLYDNVAGEATSRASTDVGEQVYRAASGDVNGDGIPDLVTDGFQSVRVWLGTPSGSYQPAPPLTGAFESYAYGTAPADVDGDGVPDLVTAMAGGSIFDQCSIQWRRGNGDGTFGAPALVTPPFLDAVRELRTADIDGDGRTDVMGRTWDRRLLAWRNTGGGTFAPMTLVGGAASVEDYALGDLDGDGDLDVVVSGRPAGPGVIEVYETTPAGPVGPVATAPLIAKEGIHTGDVNGDGTPDVLLQVTSLSGFWSQRDIVALTVGPGLSLSAPVVLAGPLDDELVWAPMDWEGDGDLDIAWGNPDLQTIGIMLDPRLGEVGLGYCDAVPNSTGARGRMDALGSLSVGADALRLRASSLPPHRVCLFLSGEGRADVFPIPSSVGRLCLGGSLGRFNRPGQIRVSGAGGQVILDLDLSALPRGATLLSAAAGATWTFQGWHRDVDAGGQTSNFTDAVEVAFTP